MQLFKTPKDAEEFLKDLETDLDRIDCLDYLILELEEKTQAYDPQDPINSAADTSEAPSSIEQWNSILPYLRRRRRDLLKIHSDDFNERLESSFPPGKRLSFPVPSSKEELMKTIRLIGHKKPSQVHQFLVWLHGVLEKDNTSAAWKLREEETWRLVLDCRENKLDWREELWRVMNIKDEFMEHLRNEEGLYYRSATTSDSDSSSEIAQGRSRNPSAPKELIPWLGSKKQLETLLELLYQNQIISNHDVDSMISIHFWDARNKRRYGTPDKESDKSYEMIPWTGTQAQLKKLFSLLANDEEGDLLKWNEIRNTIICEHFFNEKKQKPFSPKNLMKLDLVHSSWESLEKIHIILKEASKA